MLTNQFLPRRLSVSNVLVLGEQLSINTKRDLVIAVTCWSMDMFWSRAVILFSILRPRKIAAISKTIFSNAFSWMKISEFRFKFDWSLVLRVQLTFPALVQMMVWRRPGDKPFSEPMLVRLSTHICVTRPQWVKARMIQYQCLSNENHYRLKIT